MKKSKWVVGLIAVVGVILGGAWVGWAGLKDLVGIRVVEDMEIHLYMESPKDMVMPQGAKDAVKMLPASQATHHLEVKAFDVASKATIPYMSIKATITHLDSGQVTSVDVPPMIGGAFHYGDNVALGKKGTYRIELDITPPQLMRYATASDRWTASPKLSFDFEYK